VGKPVVELVAVMVGEFGAMERVHGQAAVLGITKLPIHELAA
jgi:hypothetical protein